MRDSSGNTHVLESGGAKCGAPGAPATPTDPDLAKLIAAWPTLPDAIKAGIRAMVQSITPKG